MVAAVNVVRFRVKPGFEEQFVEAHRTIQRPFKGFLVFRHMLEDLGGGMGLTDPVSGESVARIAPSTPARKAKTAPKKKRPAAKKAAKKKGAPKRKAKRR